MRMFLGIASLVIAATFSVPAAEAACSTRGRYCDYPAWAANAFEGKTGGRVWEGNDRGYSAYRVYNGYRDWGRRAHTPPRRHYR